MKCTWALFSVVAGAFALATFFAVMSGCGLQLIPIGDNGSGKDRASAGERTAGRDGNDGLSCWDLNGNGVSDLQEDINQDGVWNALDCQGPAGPPGEDGLDGPDGNTGPAGSDGQDGADRLSCWDLNGNGVAEPDEDVNADGVINEVRRNRSCRSAPPIHQAMRRIRDQTDCVTSEVGSIRACWGALRDQHRPKKKSCGSVVREATRHAPRLLTR